MTNHQAHTKKPNPDGRALRRYLRARGQHRFLVGPFSDSRRRLKSEGMVLVTETGEDGAPTKVWKQRKKLRGMGITRAPSSKRLPAKVLIDRLNGRNVVHLDTANKGPEQRKSLWNRIKDTAKQFFSGQRGRS